MIVKTKKRLTSERRTRSREAAAKLMAERAEMLALFCQVAGLEPYPHDAPPPALLQKFCQILVDYIAAGHFALYERIVKGQERRRGVAELAQSIYPRLAQTTDAALDFNDKYDSEEHCKVTRALHDDLSRLGEELAVRIELEDRLLQALSGESPAHRTAEQA